MSKLRPREREVFELRSKGYTEREVAKKLNLSYATVKTYSHRARRRTGRSSIEIAVALALAG